MSGSLTQEGSLTIKNDHGVQKFTIDRDTADVSGSGLFYNAGAATFSESIQATGSISGSSTLQAVGNSFLGGNLAVSGTVKLEGVADTAMLATDKIYFLDSDGLVKADAASDVRDLYFSAVSGDATVAAGGALTIAANAVEGSMLNNNVISGQTAMTGDVADADEIMISDDGTLKRIDFSVFRDAVFNDVSGDATVAAGGALTIANDAVESGMLNDNVISGQTELAADGLAAADELLISDGGTLKKIGVDNLFLDGPGLLTAATIAVADDHFMFLDGGATGDAKTESIADLMTAVAGDGLEASSGVLAVGVDDSTVEINSDALRIKDDGVTGAKLAPAVAGVGLKQDGSGNLELDLNELTAAAVSVANDSIAIIDADDSDATKKESIADLVAAMAGGGLTATNGVLSTQAGDVAVVGDANATLAEGMNAGSTTFTANRTWTLPAAPSDGDVVYAKAPSNLDGNVLIIQKGANSHRIDGEESIRIESNGGAVSMMWIGSNTWVLF